MTRTTILRGSTIVRKPRNSSFIIENLGCYRQNAEVTELENNRQRTDLEDIAFDIERIYHGSIKPLLYSIMINAFYRPSNIGPNIEQFMERAGSIEGFTPNNESQYCKFYTNKAENIFVDYLTDRGDDDTIDLCIGVIQSERIESLTTVIEKIIPYAVKVFNKLNPERELQEEIVTKSINLALESDKYLFGNLRT